MIIIQQTQLSGIQWVEATAGTEIQKESFEKMVSVFEPDKQMKTT